MGSPSDGPSDLTSQQEIEMLRERMLATARFGLMISLALFLSVASASSGRAKLGFGTQATISGFLKPVLKRVRVGQVVPGSPAERAGLQSGDEILEANGKKVPGAPAREMAGALRNIAPGEQLRLKVRRGDGRLLDLTIVATTAP